MSRRETIALRENFDLKLKQLNEKIIELGKLAENAFVSSVGALKNNDIDQGRFKS